MNNCLICERIELIKENKNNFFVIELETGYVVLGDFQYYEGYTLFLSKIHAVELHELTSDFMEKFLIEMANVAKAVYTTFDPLKLNYELLGNGEPHLHWHIIPRYTNDPDLKSPIWTIDKSIRYDPSTKPSTDHLLTLKSRLLKNLS